METNNIQKLYENYEILDRDKDNIHQYEHLYREFLDAVHKSASEKRLALQFIPRFFHNFPALADLAIEAQFDLCEDGEISIRRQAIKELPFFCKESPRYTKRIADILAQLLAATQPSELTTVHNSINVMFSIDPCGATEGIFNQIMNGDDSVREKCINFMSNKLKQLEPSTLKITEETLTKEIINTFQDANTEELPVFMNMLLKAKSYRTDDWRKELVDIIIAQIEVEKNFDASYDELIDRFNCYITFIMPFFKLGKVDSNKMIGYLCLDVLTHIKEIKGYEDGSDVALTTLKRLAELSSCCSALDQPKQCLENLHDALTDVMPLPNTDTDDIQETRMHFSYVECLLYSLHQLLRFHPDLFSDESRNLEVFRKRLQYFARGLQGYIKTLNSLKIDKEQAGSEYHIKAVALKTTLNINSLMKDFFRNPPIKIAKVSLSWMASTGPATAAVTEDTTTTTAISAPLAGKKRPIQARNAPHNSKYVKINKVSRPLYCPPNGKYSKAFALNKKEE